MKEHHHQILRVVDPQKQHVWGLAAAINFTAASGGAAFYIFWTIFIQAFPSTAPDAAAGSLYASALVLAGFGVLATEAGKPFRIRYLLNKLRCSWMSREVLSGTIFIGAVLSSLVLDSGLLGFVAAGAAVSLMISQAMMLFRCSAVPMWRNVAFVVAFLSSGGVFGYGLLLLLWAGWSHSAPNPPVQLDGIGLACLMVNIVAVGLLWIRSQRDGRRKMANKLKPPAKILVIVGIGQVLPLFLLFILSLSSLFSADGLSYALPYYVVGICAMLGSWLQKLWMIRDTQYLCEMEIGKGDAASAR